ncbi:hypothetical protein ATANTOWER_013082 [Ataeniobius toweri]|uniref:Uncharacterized protein n=1 Tax=Ataeniobius toweri TaxID=208326 RepID=A0ABU7C5L0_9TELE|nr:hypothetical protein [Ataeniobius toweri]
MKDRHVIISLFFLTEPHKQLKHLRMSGSRQLQQELCTLVRSSSRSDGADSSWEDLHFQQVISGSAIIHPETLETRRESHLLQRRGTSAGTTATSNCSGSVFWDSGSE